MTIKDDDQILLGSVAESYYSLSIITDIKEHLKVLTHPVVRLATNAQRSVLSDLPKVIRVLERLFKKDENKDHLESAKNHT